MKIEDIKVDELLKMSPSDIRQFCLENNLNLLEFLERLLSGNTPYPGVENTLETVVEDVPVVTETREVYAEIQEIRDTRVTSQPLDLESAESIIREKFMDYRKGKRKKIVQTFEDFLAVARSDLDAERISSDIGCQFEEFVARVLYDFAQSEKSNAHTNAALRRAKLENPVVEEEVADLLRVDFGDDVSRFIVGRLSPRYVASSYELSDFIIEFRDAHGIRYKFPGVGSERSWSGDEKNRIRKRWIDFVEETLMASRRKTLKKIIDDIERCKSEKDSLQKDVGTFESRRLSRAMKNEEYQITGPKCELDLLMGRFCNNLPRSRKEGVRFVPVGEIKPAIRVVFEKGAKTDPRGLFLEEWSKFFTDPKNKELVTKQLTNIKSNIDVNEGPGQIRRKRESISKLETRIQELESRQVSPSPIQYLGLEGVNFGSYLALASILPDFNKLSGIAVEYNHRIFNIMKSLKGGLQNPGVLRDCSLLERNIDDLVMLDFVKDPRVTLEPDGKNYLVLFRYGEKKRALPLSKFYEIIDALDKGDEPERLASKYYISHEFVRAISEKEKGKFDVAFLDYVGPFTPLRRLVLQNLIRRRLNDECVLAVTFNASGYVNHQRSSGVRAKDVPDAMLDAIPDLCRRYGFEVIDLDGESYKESQDTMSYQVYHLMRKKK